jgi:hypothetical protein
MFLNKTEFRETFGKYIILIAKNIADSNREKKNLLHKVSIFD